MFFIDKKKIVTWVLCDSVDDVSGVFGRQCTPSEVIEILESKESPHDLVAFLPGLRRILGEDDFKKVTDIVFNKMGVHEKGAERLLSGEIGAIGDVVEQEKFKAHIGGVVKNRRKREDSAREKPKKEAK